MRLAIKINSILTWLSSFRTSASDKFPRFFLLFPTVLSTYQLYSASMCRDTLSTISAINPLAPPRELRVKYGAICRITTRLYICIFGAILYYKPMQRQRLLAATFTPICLDVESLSARVDHVQLARLMNLYSSYFRPTTEGASTTMYCGWLSRRIPSLKAFSQRNAEHFYGWGAMLENIVQLGCITIWCEVTELYMSRAPNTSSGPDMKSDLEASWPLA